MKSDNLFDHENINKRCDELRWMEEGFNISRNEGKEYETLYSYYNSRQRCAPLSDVCKKYLEKICHNSYEILECKGNGIVHPYKSSVCLGAYKSVMECEIYSVKRLPDSQIFSIGDHTKYGIITGFFIGFDGKDMHVKLSEEGSLLQNI